MGLVAEIFVPALLEALHQIIPSYRNLFDWTDGDGQLTRYYIEGPIDHDINRHYFETFHNKRESEAMSAFSDAVMGRAAVHSAAELDRPAFFRSALYNEIWRPQRLHTRIEAVVRGVRGRPLGSLVLYRTAGERKFTPVDEALLAKVVPYVARGLEASTPAPGDAEHVEHPDRRAVICLDAAGELLHLSPDALKLLLLSTGDVTPQTASRPPRRCDFPTLTAFWLNQSSIGASRSNVAVTLDNAWGRFVFAACVLQPLAKAGNGVLHVTVEHHEPTAIAVRRALEKLSLTPTQKEVCLLLRTGRSQAEISRLMQVSDSTVADHVKKIYARLDVHSVHGLTDLIRRLLSTATV